MRTTITLTPDADALVRKVMRERGLSFKDAVNEAILGGLQPARPPFRTREVDLGGARVSVVKAVQLAGELENEELLRKSALGK